MKSQGCLKTSWKPLVGSLSENIPRNSLFNSLNGCNKGKRDSTRGTKCLTSCEFCAACGDADTAFFRRPTEEDKRRLCTEIANQFSVTSGYIILTDKLDKTNQFAKWTYHLLNQNEKEQRMSCSLNILLRFRHIGKSFFNKLSTGDKMDLFLRPITKNTIR